MEYGGKYLEKYLNTLQKYLNTVIKYKLENVFKYNVFEQPCKRHICTRNGILVKVKYLKMGYSTYLLL